MMSLYRWFRRQPTMTLCIYMKSGNVIDLAGVTEYEVTPGDNAPKYLKLKQMERRGVQYLIVSTIDLAQIEAITVVK